MAFYFKTSKQSCLVEANHLVWIVQPRLRLWDGLDSEMPHCPQPKNSFVAIRRNRWSLCAAISIRHRKRRAVSETGFPARSCSGRSFCCSKRCMSAWSAHIHSWSQHHASSMLESETGHYARHIYEESDVLCRNRRCRDLPVNHGQRSTRL